MLNIFFGKSNFLETYDDQIEELTQWNLAIKNENLHENNFVKASFASPNVPSRGWNFKAKKKERASYGIVIHFSVHSLLLKIW